MCRTLGPGWLAYRLRHAAAMRLGLLRRRMPVSSWAERPLAAFLTDPSLADPAAYHTQRLSGPRFFFGPEDRTEYAARLQQWNEVGKRPQERCEALARGRLTYFSHLEAEVGCPPDWFCNPFTGQRAPSDRHWSLIDDFASGDMKVIWEPSRFGFAYDLVRSHWGENGRRLCFPELFWQLVEDWRAHNPPNQGPNWKCGQETAFRVMAWCFGLYGFLDHPASTPQRVADLAQMIAVSGERIAGHLDYALSQQNNHGVSEGVGLFTIGLLFPEFRRATEWRATGRGVLERLAQELIYPDGSFAQHSTNYHRVMLDDYLWAIRLGDLLGAPLSSALRERVAGAAEFLCELVNDESGHAPCFGGNDGALVLPLSNCDYRDYRPVVQAAQGLLSGRRPFPSGPWDEHLLWLSVPKNAPEKRDRPPFRKGVCPLFRSAEGAVFVRCAAYRHRPPHADQLHVDLWWRGQNIALDPGTYSYNAPPPWDSALADTAFHNTVSVDGRDQMDRVSRFLFLPWSRGHMRGEWEASDGQCAYWEGEHDGYHRLKAPVTHRRGVLRLPGDCWVVLDALRSTTEHSYRLHWLLCDVPCDWQPDTRRLVLQTPAGPYHVQLGASVEAQLSLVRADPDSPRGWQAPYYGDKAAALSLDLIASAKTALFASVFAPEPMECSLAGGELRLAGPAGESVLEVKVGEGALLLISRKEND
jgi:asparagine synthase (glutamine-hydrolysing)